MIPELLLCAALVTSPACVENTAAHSAAAKDWKGHERSLYNGQHYHSKWALVRQCIMHRESRSNYRARGTVSSAAGAYQFLEAWHMGLTYMMIKETKATGDGLIGDIKALRARPIQEWNRYFQDRAFYTAWNNGKGADHWNLTRHGCA
jgi:hypothetical protein